LGQALVEAGVTAEHSHAVGHPLALMPLMHTLKYHFMGTVYF
jgi:hypothetical protein